MPVSSGDSAQLTHSKNSIKLLAWRPDGAALGYASLDDEPKKKDEAKFEVAFEVGKNGYLERSRALPNHLWLIDTAGGDTKRLTSGNWSLPNHFAPAGPPSQISFTPDGKWSVFVKAGSPLSGDTNSSRLEVLDVASGALRRITEAMSEESNPVLSPDGTHVAYSFSRDGKVRNEATQYDAPVAGDSGKGIAFALDRNIGNAAWMPDAKSLLIAGADGTHSVMSMQPLDGKAKQVDLGGLNAGAFNASKDGEAAFAATNTTHAPELFYMARAGDAPTQLTHLQTVTEGVALGKPETVAWKSDGSM